MIPSTTSQSTKRRTKLATTTTIAEATTFNNNNATEKQSSSLSSPSPSSPLSQTTMLINGGGGNSSIGLSVTNAMYNQHHYNGSSSSIIKQNHHSSNQNNHKTIRKSIFGGGLSSSSSSSSSTITTSLTTKFQLYWKVILIVSVWILIIVELRKTHNCTLDWNVSVDLGNTRTATPTTRSRNKSSSTNKRTTPQIRSATSTSNTDSSSSSSSYSSTTASLNDDSIPPGAWTEITARKGDDDTVWIYRHPFESIRNKPVSMTVIVLTMDRFESLQRLLESLYNADYTSRSSSTPSTTTTTTTTKTTIKPTTAKNDDDDDIRFDDDDETTNDQQQEQRRRKLIQQSEEGEERDSFSTTYNNDLDRIDLVIRFDKLSESSSTQTQRRQWKQTIRTLRQNELSTKWKFGNIQVVISNENVGLAESWFRCWVPNNSDNHDDRAVILEDDLELSPMWYQWLRGVHDAYAPAPQQQQQAGDDSSPIVSQNRTDLAAFSLSHQQLVPLKDPTKKQPSTNHFPNDQPFLYALLGSHGFSPIARVWTEFLDFVRCAQQRQQPSGGDDDNNSQYPPISISTPGLITSDWYNSLDPRGMWTQHFIYFCKQRNYYNMYQFPSSKALAAHWQEKGEHFDGSDRRRNFDLVQSGDIPLVYPKNVQKYDWGANLITTETTTGLSYVDDNQSRRPVVVMSAAVGYALRDIKPFVQSLRQVYDGDAVLLISSSASPQITSYLRKNNIQLYKTKDPGKHGAGDASWEQLNRARFTFFTKVCNRTKYSLCLTTDFRDSIFQSDPFEYVNVPSLTYRKSMLYVYEHNTPMNQWHYEKMDAESCGLYSKYRSNVENTNIINGGSIIASPDVYRLLVKYMRDEWSGCNDQVILNILVRAEMLPASTIVSVSPQGVGAINVVGWGGKVIRGQVSNRFLNLNCFVSPVVHQYDIVDK